MLNTKKLSFVVTLPNKADDPNNFYKEGLVKEIMKIRENYPGFTVAGIDRPDVRRGIEFASNNHAITIGTAKKHDVEWVERPNYMREKGYAPIFDIRKDWTKVVNRLKAYAEEHYGATTVNLSAGREAIIHRNFVKIGYKVYSYNELRGLALVGPLAVHLTPADIRALYFNLK